MSRASRSRPKWRDGGGDGLPDFLIRLPMARDDPTRVPPGLTT
jgi:hypothetical protein